MTRSFPGTPFAERAAMSAVLAGSMTLSVAMAVPVAGQPAPDTGDISLPANLERLDSAGGITQYRLRSNGMTILLAPNHAAPVFTFLVVYHVGSRNEAPGNTGSAHLLEHLLFNKSTENFGRANGHKTFQEVLFEAGADFSSTNMTTWYDRMNGFSTLPAGELALAMKIEADRLGRGLILDSERQTEMSVVRNEYEIDENDPSSALFKSVIAAAIVAHPYHWSTIGYRSDIEGVTIEKLREHYRTFFWPDNAEAILVGDFDPAEALSLFDREFGAFERSPRPIPRVITVEPPQEGERRVEIRRPGEVGIVQIAYMRPGALHPDFIPLDLLASILGEGINARLYQALVETRKAAEVSAWNFTLRDPFPILVETVLAPGSTHEEVERIVKETLYEVARDGVTGEEIDRARRQIEVAVIRGRDGTHNLARSLGEALASADWKWVVEYVDRMRAVTQGDVQRVASTYLVPEHATVGWFVPAEDAGGASEAGVPPAASPAVAVSPAGSAAPDVQRPPTSAPVSPSTAPSPSAEEASPTEAKSGAGRGGFAERTRRHVLANGIVLDIVENDQVPTFALRGMVLAGDVTAPPGAPAIPDLTAMMLSRGTTSQDKLAIAARLEGVGAQLDIASSQVEATITASGLSRDLPLVLEILAEILTGPAFPEEELVKARSELESNTLRADESTFGRALERLGQLVYPEGHPYHVPGSERMLASIRSARREDLASFHAQRYVGSSIVLAIAGDVDAAATTELVERLFGPIPRGTPAALERPLTSPGPPARAIVTMPGKANIDFAFGHASGLRRTDEDYEAALIANAAVGQNALTSRIGKRVRDTEGLSYYLFSRFAAADVLDGYWMVEVAVAPQNLAQAIRSTREEIEKYCREGITASEVDIQKSFFAGNYQVRLGSNAGVAAALVEAERFGGGPRYLDEFPARIRAVSLDEVNAVIRTRLHPDKLNLVVAGDVDRLPDEAAPDPQSKK